MNVDGIVVNVPDSQKLLSDLLKFFLSSGVGLDQLEKDSHDVHANEGEELLLVDALAGANVDGPIGGSVFKNNSKSRLIGFKSNSTLTRRR